MKLLETALYVNDLNESEKFYTEVFELELITKKENRHVFLRCRESILLLFNPDITEIPGSRAPLHGSRGQGHMAFGILDSEFDY